MEQYENILKILDEAIARTTSDLDFYREHYRKANEVVDNLTKANEVLTKKVKDLEEELDFWKPKNEKRSNMVEGEQAK